MENLQKLKKVLVKNDTPVKPDFVSRNLGGYKVIGSNHSVPKETLPDNKMSITRETQGGRDSVNDAINIEEIPTPIVVDIPERVKIQPEDLEITIDELKFEDFVNTVEEHIPATIEPVIEENSNYVNTPKEPILSSKGVEKIPYKEVKNKTLLDKFLWVIGISRDDAENKGKKQRKPKPPKPPKPKKEKVARPPKKEKVAKPPKPKKEKKEKKEKVAKPPKPRKEKVAKPPKKERGVGAKPPKPAMKPRQPKKEVEMQEEQNPMINEMLNSDTFGFNEGDGLVNQYETVDRGEKYE